MSNAVPSSSKGGGGPTQLPSPSQPQGLTPRADGHFQRSGSSGPLSTGATSRTMPFPRNNQSLRKQHKGKRPKLGFEDAAIENAAIRSISSRKGQTSITHLMNFTLPPRPQTNHSLSQGQHGNRRRPTWGLGSGYHANDKARYIHANYRFIVDPQGVYHQHTINADIHLDWNNVLQILASAQSQDTSCPICLSTPVAPRMAKCGHIFCLPCLLRYMHSTDDVQVIPENKARWKKCPICWDSIYMAETRPVKWFQGQEGPQPIEGGDVVLRLMKRDTDSILALPRDGAKNSSTIGEIPWYFAAEVIDYARIIKGSEDYMQASFDQEIEEVILQEQEDQLMFGEETHWTRKALRVIRESKEKSNGIGNPPAAPQKPEERPPKRPPIVFNKEVPDFYAIQNAASSGQSNSSVRGRESNLAKPTVTDTSFPDSGQLLQSSSCLKPAATASNPQDPPFFFYQALLHYYLAPLDIRILRAAFGDYSLFPATILPRIEHVSTGHIVDDELRKRAKYLGHLPQGCEVNFLECNWTDVVPPSVLEGFAKEIARRRKRNSEKEVREEKDRQKAERDEDEKRWAAARRKRPSLSKAKESNLMGIPRGSDVTFEETLAIDTSTTSSSSPPWGSHSRCTGSTFASLATPSTSPSAPRTVWGTTLVTPASPSQEVAELVAPSENDGWLQGWEQDLLREELLVSQINETSIGDTGGSYYPAPTSSSGNRKKKIKKITLMSTNARRAA